VILSLTSLITCFDVVEKQLELNDVSDLGFIVFDESSIKTLGGNYELETVKRMMAVKELYPEKFIEYVRTWRKNPITSYWQDALNKLSINSVKVKSIADSKLINNKLRRYASIWKNHQPDHYLYVLVNNRELHKINEDEIFKIIESIK